MRFKRGVHAALGHWILIPKPASDAALSTVLRGVLPEPYPARRWRDEAQDSEEKVGQKVDQAKRGVAMSTAANHYFEGGRIARAFADLTTTKNRITAAEVKKASGVKLRQAAVIAVMNYLCERARAVKAGA